MRFLIFIAALPILGQATDQDRILRDMAQFQSSDALQREVGFRDIASTGCPICQGSSFPVIDGIQNAIRNGSVPRDVIAQNLISLLEHEGTVKSLMQTLTFEYSDYLGDLVQAVCWLRDKRSERALFFFMESGGMAEDALAGFGEDSLKDMNDVLSSHMSSALLRNSAIRIMTKMIQKRNLERFTDPVASRATIKAAMIKGLAEPDYFTRISALEGIGELGDPDLRPLVEQVLHTDAYSDTSPRVIGPRYPVRDEAQRALGALATKSLEQ